MSIEAIVESWPDLETIQREKYYPGTVYYYLDECVGRLILARSLGLLDEGAIIHAVDGFKADPRSLTMAKVREICVPEAVIAEIMPWGREIIEVHKTDGEPALLTVKHKPKVLLTLPLETALE